MGCTRVDKKTVKNYQLLFTYFIAKPLPITQIIIPNPESVAETTKRRTPDLGGITSFLFTENKMI